MSLKIRTLACLKPLALAAAALAFAASSSVQAKTLVCVWDVAGKTGDVYAQATDYVIAMQKHGADIELKSYVDERVAIEDFRAGQCDGVIATGFANAFVELEGLEGHGRQGHHVNEAVVELRADVGDVHRHGLRTDALDHQALGLVLSLIHI